MSVRNGTGWIWQIDGAAARARPRSLMIASALCYVLGAVALLAQMPFHLPGVVSSFGVGLVLLGVALSVGIAGKIMLARGRAAYR